MRTKTGHINKAQDVERSLVVPDGGHGSLQVKNLTAAYSRERRLDACAQMVLMLRGGRDQGMCLKGPITQVRKHQGLGGF